MLILPGGTMNLLARALHGEQPCEDIITAACRDQHTRKLNTVDVGDHRGYVGVIAGPTTSWAKVREGARHNEVAELVFNAIPAAISESLSGPQVGIEGDDRTFPAIFAAPRDDALSLRGFTATGVGEVIAHANAWMSGDFREGPHVDLGSAAQATLTSESSPIGLLIDGEPAECQPGDQLTLGHAPHNFVLHADRPARMTVLFHASDLHFGAEDPAALDWFAERVADEAPDAVVITGDLTMRARSSEFAAAQAWLSQLGAPVLIEPGNHDLPYFNPVQIQS